MPTNLQPCDLIMKGGITSGVIYPRLISMLANRYTFKSIGGSSAGAIAAVGAAAAEYGRRHGKQDAFARLSEMPDELKRRDNGHSKLFHLFQPARSLKGHFRVMTSALNLNSKARMTLALLWSLLVNFPLPVLVVATLAIVVLHSVAGTFASGSIEALVATIVVVLLTITNAIVAASVWFFWTLLVRMSGLGFGICTGMPGDRNPTHEALTPWMHRWFNALAGLPEEKEPLTFGHLWECGADDRKRDAAAEKSINRALDLQVMTTALSQGRPYSLPFRLEFAHLFLYDPTEWARLFPENVFRFLKDHSKVSGALHPDTGEATLLHLPHPADLPVVVAARMSLSFPLLLSAVPLYAVDWSRSENWGDGMKTATRVWFSDGGIGSNLPLHFFDSKLPPHPTFAINLKAFHPDHLPGDGDRPGYENGRVYLPTPTPTASVNQKGLSRYWAAVAPDSGVAGVVGFVRSIVETMHSWHDELFFPLPGYRDRIAQVSQRKDEGGLNLDMPEKQVEALSLAGENAAKQIIDRFLDSKGNANGWTNHRWVRMRTLLGLLEEMVLEIDAEDSAQSGWRELLKAPPSYPFAQPSDEHLALAENFLATTKASATNFRDANSQKLSLTKELPHPEPELRIVPPI
jgi:predicted acylesterase/phospholipase RssA